LAFQRRSSYISLNMLWEGSMGRSIALAAILPIVLILIQGLYQVPTIDPQHTGGSGSGARTIQADLQRRFARLVVSTTSDWTLLTFSNLRHFLLYYSQYPLFNPTFNSIVDHLICVVDQLYSGSLCRSTSYYVWIFRSLHEHRSCVVDSVI